MGIFNFDNPFMTAVYKIMNCILLCFLWMLCSIPIVTFGASTTALYYTIYKVLRYERSYPTTEFFSAFRENFKQSTIAWLIILAVGLIFLGDISIMKAVVGGGHDWGNVYVVFYVLIGILAIYMIYIFAYIARFENTLSSIFKNSALLMIGRIGNTIIMAAELVFGYVIVRLVPPLILLMPAVILWLMSGGIEKIFYSYMSDEDKAAEDERNRIYQQGIEELIKRRKEMKKQKKKK